MDTLKNIFQTILMIWFLLKRSVDSSGKITQLLDLNDTPMEDDNTQLLDLNDTPMEDDNTPLQFDLNDIPVEDGIVEEDTQLSSSNDPLVIHSDRLKERKLCALTIHEELECPKPPRTRSIIPKKVLATININNLVSRYTIGYVNYLVDIVIPVTKISPHRAPRNMKNPREFCESKFLEQVHFELVNFNCIERLRQFYTIKENTTEVLKDALKHLVIIDALYSEGDYAYEYYQHILQFMGYNVGENTVWTPTDYCKHRIPLPEMPLTKKRTPAGEKKNQPKSRKYDSTSARRNLPSSSNQQA